MKYECEPRCFNYPLECSKCKTTSDIYNHNPCFLDRNSDLVKRIKAEAIKEFADRLKEDFRNSTLWGLVSFDRIGNLVKEIVGEDK